MLTAILIIDTQESRRQRIKKVCAERGMDTAEAEERLGHDVGWEFMIAAKKGLVWCHVFKSASSRSVD